MAEYIEKNHLLDKIREYIEEYSEVDADGYHDAKWCAMKEAEMVVMDSDVVEVVRCKDCIHGEVEDSDCPNRYFCHNTGETWNDENFYCSDGERKDGLKEEPQPTGVRPITDSFVFVANDTTVCVTQPIKKMYGTLNWETGEYTTSERDEA